MLKPKKKYSNKTKSFKIKQHTKSEQATMNQYTGVFHLVKG